MAAHVIARLRPQVSDIVISANTDGYAGFGFPVIADSLPAFPGPLAGVERVLNGLPRTGPVLLGP